MENAQVHLFDQMLAVFNEEDIRELCFRLNTVYGDLNGQNRRAKTISLVEYCHQTNRIAELITLCQKAPPSVAWPEPDAINATVSATTEPSQPEKPTPPRKQTSKIPLWIGAVVGLLLLALVILAIWQPWQGREEGAEETAVTPAATSFSSSSQSGNKIDLNQTVSGKIVGAKPQAWTYIGPSKEVDIRVDGGPDDTFVIILTYETGGEAAYIDYSGRGKGELVTYYDLQENMKILVDETENDGADYTLSVTVSEPKYLYPNVSYGGELLGANPKYFIFTGYPTPVDTLVFPDFD